MKNVFFGLALVLSSTAFAQFEIGVRGGLNFTDMRFKDITLPNIGDRIGNESGSLGYHAGIYAKLSLLIVGIQPELLYTRFNGKISGEIDGQAFTEDVGVNRLDIPVLGITKFGPLRLGGGPVFSYQFSSVNDVIEEGLNSSTWGIQLLAGLEFWKIQLDTRYEFGLSKGTDAIFIDGTEYGIDNRPSQFIIALAYKLN